MRELERIAEAPSLRTGRLADFHAYVAKIVAERRQFSNLVLFDLAGQPLVNALIPFGRPLPVLKRSLEEQVVTSGQRVVSDVIPNTVDGAPSIAIAVPVKVDGVLRGVLTARLDHEDLSRLLAEQQARAGGVAAILDRADRFVGRSRDAGKIFGTEAPDYFRELLRSGPRGAAPSRSLEGRSGAHCVGKTPIRMDGRDRNPERQLRRFVRELDLRARRPRFDAARAVGARRHVVLASRARRTHRDLRADPPPVRGRTDTRRVGSRSASSTTCTRRCAMLHSALPDWSAACAAAKRSRASDWPRSSRGTGARMRSSRCSRTNCAIRSHRYGRRPRPCGSSPRTRARLRAPARSSRDR